jgi:hypothetical protein
MFAKSVLDVAEAEVEILTDVVVLAYTPTQLIPVIGAEVVVPEATAA